MEVKRERAEKMRISDPEAGLTPVKRGKRETGLEEHQAEMQLRWPGRGVPAMVPPCAGTVTST